jgi:hypothetical protein
MRPAKFVGQSYITSGRYGFRYESAKHKHISRAIARNLKRLLTPIYKNYE